MGVNQDCWLLEHPWQFVLCRHPRFVAYGTPTGDLPDPVARAIDGLLDEVQTLRARVNSLEERGQTDALDVEDGSAERGAERPQGKY
jgi:serine O-acetyltransferase